MKLFTATEMNHTPHILASVFLCGLWLPVWILITLTEKLAYHCNFCGFSDETKYLVNPYLRAEEKKRAQVKAEEYKNATSSFEKIKTYPHLFQLGIGFFVLCVVSAFVIIAVVKSRQIVQLEPPKSSSSSQINTKNFPSSTEIKDLSIKNIGKYPPKWNDLVFTKIENNAVTIHLTYKQMPANMREVETDTNRIAKAVLDAVRSKNYDPAANWFSLFVHAQKREANGSVRRFGKTMFDFNNGNLTFSEAGSFK